VTAPRSIRTALAIVLFASPALAVQTRTHHESAQDLERGTADGVALTGEGRLFLAPRLTRLAGETLPRDPVHVWALTADSNDNVYVGTGPDGHVLKISPTGRASVLFTVEEPMVTALAALPGGELLAAAAPGGRIYRIDGDGSGEVWSETDQRYVWSLAIGPDGTTYAGTGEEGLILEIQPFFDSGEAHIVTLVSMGDRGLLAGGAGRGLVYQVDRDGNAIVLYGGDLAQASGLVGREDGSVVAGLIGSPRREAKAPELKIRLPGGSTITPSNRVATLDDPGESTLRGRIEGLVPEPAVHDARPRGKIVRIAPDGNIALLWESTSHGVFGLVENRRGELLFGSGEPARLYRVEQNDDVALLAELPEAQATALFEVGRSVFVATSNPAAIYRLDEATAATGVFLSRPLDAGAPARWGSVGWHEEEGSGSAELYTRTGNSASPDATWSAWSPELTRPEGSAIVNPDGRYLQWRVRFSGGGRGASPRISAVKLVYSPYNRPPDLSGLHLESPAGVAGEIAFGWTPHDPDGDEVEVRMEYRPRGAAQWIELQPAPPPDEVEGRDADAGRTRSRLTWDVSAIAEVRYEIRATASDESANPPGEGHRAVRDGPEVTIDRTPPQIDLGGNGTEALDITVIDAHSDVSRLEVLENGRTRFTLRPVDGVYDSREERFRFEFPETPAGAGWSVRGVDAAGNSAEQALEPPQAGRT